MTRVKFCHKFELRLEGLQWCNLKWKVDQMILLVCGELLACDVRTGIRRRYDDLGGLLVN